MFYIENGKIHLTRGDYAKIKCDMTDGEGTPYEMQDGDSLTLTIRKKPKDDSTILAQITSLTDEIAIQHEDTASIDPGSYSADIQLTTSDGKRFTFFPDTVIATTKNYENFVIGSEVTEE